MPHRIMKRTMLFGSLLLIGLIGTAQGYVPCQSRCTTTLTAQRTAQTWKVPGEVGERFLLYLNVYEDGKRLPYKRLIGGCAASYASPDVAAVLHACGKRSSLRYVAFEGVRKIKIVYSYEPR